jgi:MFS family permease
MSAEPYPRPRVAWYALFVLTLCYMLAYVDRQIVAFLIDPMKRELSITDTQIGMLGIWFALFYTVFGMLCGYLADRYNRRTIIAVGVFLWSITTALGAVVRSYATLALARMGVGLGEATMNPCAFSMVSDYFPKDRLATALSVYMMGIQLGSGLALIIGGAAVHAISLMPPVDVPGLGVLSAWRLTFLAVGVPGLLFVLLVMTVKEPVRRNVIRDAQGRMKAMPLRDALSQIFARWRSVIGIALMISSQAMCNYSLLNWGPAYFERVHGWSRDRIGLTLGTIAITAGCIGLVAGGRLADRWIKQGVVDGTLRVGLISLVGVGVSLPMAMLWSDPDHAVATLVFAVFFIGLPIGCSYAALQHIFPNQMRGVASSVVLLVVNFVGIGLGWLLPGLMNDRLFQDPLKVGYSIATTVICASVFGTIVVLLTMKPYRRHFSEMRNVS